MSRVLDAKRELIDSIYQQRSGLISYEELRRRAANYVVLFFTEFKLKFPGQRPPKITVESVLRNLTP